MRSRSGAGTFWSLEFATAPKAGFGLTNTGDSSRIILRRTVIPFTQTGRNGSTGSSLRFENEALKVAYGCPAGNLAQEMAPWNTVFTEALADLTNQWKQALELCISNGKKAGLVRKDIAASQVAVMVMSGYWGVRNMGKLYNDTTCYHAYLKELKQYLQGLK